MAKAKDGKPDEKPPSPNKKNEPEDKTQPKGAYLVAAAKAQRDSLMIERFYGQDWPWDAVAAEAGISVSAAMRAVKARLKEMPSPLEQGPMEVLERLTRGMTASIGDYEAMAHAALKDHNVAAAVGAKRGANDARNKILGLLQSTGRLPKELGTLRHLFDLRDIATKMLDVMDRFKKGEVDADEVITFFNELIGITVLNAALPESVEGSAVDA